jgi:MFS family permease
MIPQPSSSVESPALSSTEVRTTGSPAAPFRVGDECSVAPPAIPSPPLAECVEVTSTRRQSETPRAQAKSFWLMSLYQVLMRTGWIFKTESIIMPAVLDMLGGAAWTRGCLPLLNRFGQSIPPLLAAGAVSRMPCKKYSLAVSTAMMGLVLCGLAGLWWMFGDRPPAFLPIVFLAAYALFFISVGVNQLSVDTLIGKLIEVGRRGRLMQVSNIVGATCAVGCAAYLLSRWLDAEHADFAAIFGFAGACFLACALVALWLPERADSHADRQRAAGRSIGASLRTLRDDKQFRRLATVAALFGMSMALFPHYQALGRTRLELGVGSLFGWVIAQNIGMAIFSIPVGWLVDRFGNRLVLRLLMAGVCGAPVLALVLATMPGVGERWFFLVFCFVGLTPVTIRALIYYTLELAPQSKHPPYLGALSLAMAGPAMIASPVVGILIDTAGFESAFSLIIAGLVVGWLLTWRLAEPRRLVSRATAESDLG